MLRRWVLTTMVLACVSGARGDEDPTKNNPKQLEGTWAATKVVAGGMDAPEAVRKEIRFIVKGDRITFKSARETNSARIKLNTSKKPHHLDAEILDGMQKGKKRLAIYEVSGDTLKLCWGDEKERPTAFSSKTGEKTLYFELKKAKE